MNKNSKKTALHITPLPEGSKEKYLLSFYDEKAYEQYQAGENEDNIILTGFCVENHKGTIGDIIVEFENGKPNAVRIVEQ